MSVFDGLIDRIVSAKPLLAGVIVGLAACAYGGHAAGRVNLFKSFDRFHSETDYRTSYQLSANQMRALTREAVRPDQIAVIVAGNSIMYGSGQNAEGLWTRQLQAELGDRYRVLNLAQPGVGPSEFGAIGAEMLYKDGHHRLIVITNNWIAPFSPLGEPDGRPVIQWFYRDAAERGLLLDCPERDARLALPITDRVDKQTDKGLDQNKRDELERQAAIDHWMNYRDLWNTVEYKYAVTVWQKPFAKSWRQARRKYPDSEPLWLMASPAHLQALQPNWMAFLQNTIVGSRPLVRRPNGEVIPPGELGGPFQSEEALRTNFPPPMRERLIVIANHMHPYFVEQLTADDRITYDAMIAAMKVIYARTGVQVVDLGRGYTPADYCDHAHLTIAGGRRLADDLAPVIQQKAAQLGYLEETKP